MKFSYDYLTKNYDEIIDKMRKINNIMKELSCSGFDLLDKELELTEGKG